MTIAPVPNHEENATPVSVDNPAKGVGERNSDAGVAEPAEDATYLDVPPEPPDKEAARKARRASQARERRGKEKRERFQRDGGADARVEAEMRAATVATNEALLGPALTETFELLADSAHWMALHPEDPYFGRERAERLGSLWAKVLAPHLDSDVMKWLPIVIAGSATAGAVASWGKEIRQERQERRGDNPSKPASKVPANHPKSVPASLPPPQQVVGFSPAHRETDTETRSPAAGNAEA